MFPTPGFAVVWAWSRSCLSQPLLAVIHTPHMLCSDLTRGKAPPTPTLTHQRFIKARFSMIFCLFPYSQLVVLTLPVSCQSDSGSQAELWLKWPPAPCVCLCVLAAVGIRWRHGGSTWATGQGDKWTVTCRCCTKNVRIPHVLKAVRPHCSFACPRALLPPFFVFLLNP